MKKTILRLFKFFLLVAIHFLSFVTDVYATHYNCHNYFLESGFLSRFSSEEKLSLDVAARVLVDLLGKPEKDFLRAKEDINTSMQKAILIKKMTEKEIALFKNWFKERIEFYSNLKAEIRKKSTAQIQRRNDNLRKQKLKSDAENEKLQSILKKYNSENLSEALLAAYESITPENSVKKKDILFILDRYEQLEITDEVFQVVVQYDHFPAVDHFIRKKINLRSTDEELGNIPLHLAASYNPNPKIIELLIQADPSTVNTVNSFKNTPLHDAAGNTSATSSHLDLLKVLLDAGANLLLKNISNEIPLHYLVQNSKVSSEAIRLFLSEQKWDQLNARDTEQGTILQHAADNGNFIAVKALLEMGANPSLADESGWLSLHAAIKNGTSSIELIQLLIAADPSQLSSTTNIQGATPLYLAAEYYPKLLGVLIAADRGAHINTRNNLGNAPLHIAIFHSVSAIKTLLDVGADPTLQDNDKKTPYDKLKTLPPLEKESAQEREQKLELLLTAIKSREKRLLWQ